VTAVWVTIKSWTRWLLTVLYAALVPMLAIASTTLANAHVLSGWFRRTRTAWRRMKSRNDLHSICFPRHTRGPQGADGGTRPSTLRPWQSHAVTDVTVTMSRSLAGMREDRRMQMVQPNLLPAPRNSTPSHTCDHPFLARAKRSNLARGGARAEVA
jgi:hypothetical protein